MGLIWNVFHGQTNVQGEWVADTINPSDESSWNSDRSATENIVFSTRNTTVFSLTMRGYIQLFGVFYPDAVISR